MIKEFAALRKFEQTWNTLGVDGTSSDEEISRGGQRQYIIHNLEWRSQEFTGFCRKLDVLHLSKRKTKVDAYGNITFGRGASPRQRLELGNYTKTKRTPIVGLPINCYDESWLKKEEENFPGFTKIRIRATSSIDFSLPEDIERYISMRHQCY